MSGHESDSEFFRLGVAMYGLAHHDHIVDTVRTISYFFVMFAKLISVQF